MEKEVERSLEAYEAYADGYKRGYRDGLKEALSDQRVGDEELLNEYIETHKIKAEDTPS